MRNLLIFALSLILFSGCESFLGDALKSEGDTTNHPDEQILYASITGQVSTDAAADSENGIEGVTVTAVYAGTTKTTTTDSDGWWWLADIPYRPMDTDDWSTDNKTEYRSAKLWFTHNLYKSKGGTVSLYGHSNDQLTLKAWDLKWTSNVIHRDPTWTNATYPKLVSADYDREDTHATTAYYLPDKTSNITVEFNMAMHTSWVGNSPFELMDTTGSQVAYTGGWSGDKKTFTVNPSADLSCTNKLEYYRLRVIRRLRTYDSFNETYGQLHYIDSGQYIDFRVLCTDEKTLLAASTPELYPGAEATTTTSYLFDSMGVDALDSFGDVITGNAADGGGGHTDASNKDIWLKWPHVSGAVDYRLYVMNMKLVDDTWVIAQNWDTDANNENSQTEDKFTNWRNTGETPEIDEISSTVRVQISSPDLYSADYMGDSLLTNSEKVRFIATAIDADGFESPIASTTPLEISDTKGPRLITDNASAGAGSSTEGNTNSVVRSIELDFSEPMKTTSTTQAEITLTDASPSITSITETGAWLWSDNTTWKDSDLAITFDLPSASLVEAHVYGGNSISTNPSNSSSAINRRTLKVDNTSSFIVGDNISMVDSAGVRHTVLIGDIDSVNNLIHLGADLTPSTGYQFDNGTAIKLMDRSGLTAFKTALAAHTQQGTNSITVTSDPGFVVNDSIKIYNLMGHTDKQSASSSLLDCDTDVVTATITAISGTTFTISEYDSDNYSVQSSDQMTHDMPVGSVVLPAAVTACAEYAGRDMVAATQIDEEIIWDTSEASTKIRSTSEYNDEQPTVILVDNENQGHGINVGDFVTIAASTASTTLSANDTPDNNEYFNSADNYSGTAWNELGLSETVQHALDNTITVTSTADFRKGDIIHIHGSALTLSVTDDGGTGDNHTLRDGVTDNFSLTLVDDGGTGDNHTLRDNSSYSALYFSDGKLIWAGATVSIIDPAVSTTTSAAWGDNATNSNAVTQDNISLTSTVGLAEGMVLEITRAAISTTLGAALSDNISADGDNTYDNITVASTAGIAVGMTLSLDNGTSGASVDNVTVFSVPSSTIITVTGRDNNSAISTSTGISGEARGDNVTISKIHSASAVNVTGIGTVGFASGDTVTRAVVSYTDTVGSGKSGKDNITFSSAKTLALSDSAQIWVKQGWSKLALTGTDVTVYVDENVTYTDAAVMTHTNARIARDVSTDNISLVSTAGLAEGQTLIIEDGRSDPDEVRILNIHSASAVEVENIDNNTVDDGLAWNNSNDAETAFYETGAKVTRAKVTGTGTMTTDNRTNSGANTYLRFAEQSTAISDSTVFTMTRATEEAIVDNITSSTVLGLRDNVTVPHLSGTAVTLYSYPEFREVTAVGPDALTLSSALVVSHHENATVTKNASALVELVAGKVDTVVPGDVAIIDIDGLDSSVKDRLDGTVLSVRTDDKPASGGKSVIVMSLGTGRTTVLPRTDIQGGTPEILFMGDAVKVTGGTDSSGNAQQTDYARYFNVNSAGIDKF